MACAREALVELGPEGGVYREPFLAWCPTEERVVEAVETSQLDERIGMVVDAEIDERVRESCIAAVALDNQHGGRLAATAIASGRLGGVEAIEQALGER